MIKTIVVATDGSEHAQKAVAFAADLASKYQARLVAVHVMLRGELSENLLRWSDAEQMNEGTQHSMQNAMAEIPEGRFPVSMVAPSRREGPPYQILQAVGDGILDRAVKVAKDHGVTSVERHLLDGDPVKRILEIAKKEKADTLVTGSRGLSDLASLVMGSVSHKLAHLAPMTCISVR